MTSFKSEKAFCMPFSQLATSVPLMPSSLFLAYCDLKQKHLCEGTLLRPNEGEEGIYAKRGNPSNSKLKYRPPYRPHTNQFSQLVHNLAYYRIIDKQTRYCTRDTRSGTRKGH